MTKFEGNYILAFLKNPSPLMLYYRFLPLPESEIVVDDLLELDAK